MTFRYCWGVIFSGLSAELGLALRFDCIFLAAFFIFFLRINPVGERRTFSCIADITLFRSTAIIGPKYLLTFSYALVTAYLPSAGNRFVTKALWLEIVPPLMVRKSIL